MPNCPTGHGGGVPHVALWSLGNVIKSIVVLSAGAEGSRFYRVLRIQRDIAGLHGLGQLIETALHERHLLQQQNLPALHLQAVAASGHPAGFPTRPVLGVTEKTAVHRHSTQNKTDNVYFLSSLQITGKLPKEWWALGKARHVPSRKYRHGRGVVRELYKEGACAMSLAEELVVKNVNETKAIAIGQESIRVFRLILEAGVVPAEWHASPLDGIGDEKPL